MHTNNAMRVLAFLLFVVVAAPAAAQGPQAGRAAGPPPSPTAADGVAYHVTYLESLTANRPEAVAALKTYRDASRRDAGAVRIDVFEQIGRPTHFVLIEVWSTLENRDTHSAAAHTKALRDAWGRLGASGYDERPYKTLSVVAPTGESARAVHVVSHIDTVPTPGADGPGLLRRVAETSRAETGNLRFDVLQHAARGNHFTVVESWASQEAAEAHAAAAHTRQYRLTVTPMTGSPLDERTLRALE